MSELSAIAAQVIGQTVSPSTPLMAAGLDSLASIEFRNSVAAKFSITLPATVAFDYPTLDSLAKFVHEHLPGASGEWMNQCPMNLIAELIMQPFTLSAKSAS